MKHYSNRPKGVFARRGSANSIIRSALLVIGCGLLLANAAPSDDLRGADDVAEVLLEGRKSDTPGEKLVVRLASGGEPTIPLAFDILVRGRFEVFVGERGNSTRTLRAGERDALVAAFGQFSWTEVRTFLDRASGEAPDESERLAALDILGRNGTAKDFSALLRWSGPAEAERRAARTVCYGFEEALGNVLDREPVSSDEVADLYRAAHLSLVPSVLRGLGARPSEERIDALAEVLGIVPEADALVLTELGQQGKLVRHPIDQGARERVRVYLTGSEPARLVAAILATEQMEDVGAVPVLVELLEHADRNVRDRALMALKSITTEQLGRDPTAWREWYASALNWWNERAPELKQQVGDVRPSIASRAVLELSKHRFFRHELADSVARGLDHAENEVVILTCAALGHLASPKSALRLIERIDDHDLEVRRAALLALRRMTGEDHGEDPQAWIDAGWQRIKTRDRSPIEQAAPQSRPESR